MTRATQTALAIAWLFTLAACNGSSGTPTGPGPIASTLAAAGPTVGLPPGAPQGPLPATLGTITLRELNPGAGASLAVRSCVVGGVARDCADGWSGAFDVTVHGDIAWPVLTVRFYDGPRLCGYAAATLESNALPAGVSTTFRPSRINVTDEWGTFVPPCALPVTTTRVVAELWTDTNWNVSVRQEFNVSYTFVKP